MQQWMFKAVLTMELPARGEPGRPYPSEAHGLMVCAGRRGQPGRLQYFPAVIATDDEEPLEADHRGHIVTITVRGEEPGQYLAAGQQITIWSGRDIGHGVISRRVFFP